MRVRSVDYDDDSNPATFDVRLTADEMALLYALTGRLAPKDVADAAGDVRWGNALYDMAEAAGNEWNRHYDSGARAVAPSFRLGVEPD